MTAVSVCIPNWNYGRYIAETVHSALDQEGVDVEVVVSDNASTDDSLEVLHGIDDVRLHVRRNEVNVGFAGNLDRAVAGASHDLMLLLSSDDVLLPGALARLAPLVASGDAVASAAVERIDAVGAPLGLLGADAMIWPEPPVDGVRSLDAGLVLGRCLDTMRNPFNFATTLFPRSLHGAVGGYGGGRTFGPDKWFHWRLLAVADRAAFVDEPLAKYRWHESNQAAGERSLGALRFLVDDYLNTIELDDAVLARAGRDRDVVVRAFAEFDVGRHGLATLAAGDRVRAQRILQFGRATHPIATRRARAAIALRALLLLGPLGAPVARIAHQRLFGSSGVVRA